VLACHQITCCLFLTVLSAPCTGGKAEAWRLRIHADASISLPTTRWLQVVWQSGAVHARSLFHTAYFFGDARARIVLQTRPAAGQKDDARHVM
jgi:hypothetical protein